MNPVEGMERGAFHVGVNAHLLSLAKGYRSAGINWHIYNLLGHLPEADPAIAYTVYLGDKRYAGVQGLQLRHTRLPTHNPMVRILWEQAVQPWAVRHDDVDLVHGPAFVGPQVGGRAYVVTVHDLSFLLYPQNFRALNRLYLRYFTSLSVQRARRVIAVSKSTKQDLIRHYGLSPNKIDVVHNGVDVGYQPMPVDQVATFRSKSGLPDQFLLFVGTLEPRKNIVHLIEAYARLPKGRPPLMLVGGRGWFYDEIFSRVENLNLTEEVHFVGYVPAEELPWWYNAATIFVYPSLYEGFGLPPLEAMACGTPVVASTASSLPEVVGQAGLLVDPDDVQGLTTAITKVLADGNTREEMRAMGLAQAEGFSWQKSASGTVDSYRQAMISEEGIQGV